MDPRAFINEISRLAPSASQLKEMGLKQGEIEDFRASYTADEREGADDPEADVLVRLLTHWDLIRIKVGMLRFLTRPDEMEDKTCVGYVEADPLVLIKATGEIVVEDLDAPGHVLWPVARKGPALLDALAIAARFLVNRAIGEVDFDDESGAESAANDCAALAGGDRYWKFYSMLVGAA